MPLDTQVGISLSHILLNEDTAPPKNEGTAPNIRPMSVVAKQSRISAIAEHLLLSYSFGCSAIHLVAQRITLLLSYSLRCSAIRSVVLQFVSLLSISFCSFAIRLFFCHTFSCSAIRFYRASYAKRGLGSRNTVRPSVTRVLCD